MAASSAFTPPTPRIAPPAGPPRDSLPARHSLRRGISIRPARSEAHEIRDPGDASLKTLNVHVPPAYTDGDELPAGRVGFQEVGMGRVRKAAGTAWRTVGGWVGRADLIVLLAVLAGATSVWAFLAIADRVAGAPPGSFDERLLRGLRSPDDPAAPVGPRWVQEAARDATALGGYTVLALLVAAVLGHLMMGRHYPAALLVLAATAGGALLSLLLKDHYVRPRPDLVPHLVRVSSSSFPSGHAMLSAVVYLTLGALLARLVAGWWAKVYFVAVATVLTLMVGASRVYLGVHYPTDVAAGWAAGVAWAVVCWLAARYLQRHGVVEREADGDAPADG